MTAAASPGEIGAQHAPPAPASCTGGHGTDPKWRADVFNGAPQASNAAKFGTVGINFRARKPSDEAEWHRTLASLRCDVGDRALQKGDQV